MEDIQTNNKNDSIHFFDLDGTIFTSSALWWIVDKQDPENAIIKITPHQGSLTMGGFFKPDNLKFGYNGLEGWFSKETFQKIQNKKTVPLERLGISLREFTDSALIASQADTLQFHLYRLEHLSGTGTKINLLTARGNKEAHQIIIDRLENELLEMDIQIESSVFTNDPKCCHFVGNTGLKKSMVMLQNIVGYEIESDQFVPKQVDSYTNTYFYDDEQGNIDACLQINQTMKHLLNNTQPWLKEMIEKRVMEVGPILHANMVTSNELNPFQTTEVPIILID